MIQITRYIRRHHIALLALFVALGGTSYAAVNLPKGSVGTAQLKQGAVTSKKIRDGAVATGDLRTGAVTQAKLRNGAVTSAKLRNDSVSSAKVQNGSLLAEDFAPGQLPNQNGPAGGALTGNYPNPGIADGAVGPDQIGTIPTVRLIRGSSPTVAVASGGQGTPIPWPEAAPPRAYDIGGFFNIAQNTEDGICTSAPYGGADTCIVFPRSGTYVISAGLRWNETADTGGVGFRTIRIHGSAGRQAASSTTPAMAPPVAPATNSQTLQSITTIDRFEAGDFAYVTASQTSGEPVNIAGSLQQVHFAATWIAP